MKKFPFAILLTLSLALQTMGTANAVTDGDDAVSWSWQPSRP